MKAVLLDAATLGEDIDLQPLRDAVTHLEVYPHSATDQCRERLAGAEAAICNKVVLDTSTLAALPDLKLICVLATGTDNIDREAAAQQDITVRNIRAYGTASVAQHTLMLMLALANRLPVYQREVAAGRWQQSQTFCLLHHRVLQLEGKHLVIVGQGELGKRVGQMAAALGMRVSFTARPGAKVDTRLSLQSLVTTADVLSLHCPLTQSTRDLVNAALIDAMKPGALLINCARGGIVDDEAALQALRRGHLGGLAVDVLPQEPPREGHVLLSALARNEQDKLNLIVTPHNAWTSPEARQRIIELTAENLRLGFNSPGLGAGV